MNKIILTIIAVLILITGTVFLINTNDSEVTIDTNKSENNTNQNTQEKEDISNRDNQPVTTEEPISSAGAYVDYSEQSLADSSDTKRIVFFHAPWCSTCNFFEGQIEDQGVPTGVTILKVDFDSESELKAKYGVNIQSTFVLLNENGEAVNSWPFARGLTSIQDLYEQV